MLENILASELKVGDCLYYNTKNCWRSPKASRGIATYGSIQGISKPSNSTIKVRVNDCDQLVYLLTDTVQVDREEKGYILQPRKRSHTFNGVSIE